jgi:cytochrome P450
MTETHMHLLHFLLSPDENTGIPKSDHDIKAAMFSVFFGTTALALPILWSLYFLSDRPEMLGRLRDELQSVSGPRAPTREELKQLPYLGCFTKEVLRIYPPFWGSLRYSRAPLEMDGYEFPARSIFAMIRIATHHHPDYWQDPETFMPERFQADQMQRGVREAYLPFGLGPRLCLGRHLANMMVPIIVAALIGQFDVAITSPKPARRRYTFGVHPRDKVMASIRGRD